MSNKTVIVGGVAGGASAAARLRRLDEEAEIVMFERGEYISFANCGLPYYIGNEIKQKSALTLQTPQSFNKRFNVDVRNNQTVAKINPDKKTVSVKNNITGEEYEEDYDNLILSMGAKPIVPNIKGVNDQGVSDKVFTLRNIPDTFKIEEYIKNNSPKSAIVVGAGFIGLEMAENLQKAGLEVTVCELADQVASQLDYDMACDISNYISQKGIKLMLSSQLTELKNVENRLKAVINSAEYDTDMVLLSIGVTPESDIAEDCGIQVNAKGAIKVDENMKTSIPDIYAVGDAVEVTNFVTGQKVHIPLAGPANKQGRIAADNICGIPSKYKNTQGSSVLKVFDMTAASTGINEKTAKALGLNYDKVFTYSASHATYYPGANNISIKTIFDKSTGKILGAQLVGFDGVDKRCDVMAVAIRAGLTAYDLTELELCYAPPFSSAKDPVNMAGYVIENLLTGKVKNFHWHDIADLQKQEGAQLLDVRNPAEVEAGKIDGFVNIPLDSLRQSADKLAQFDKSKPLFIHCHSGLRSYIACRILSGMGYDCYNLSGGYRLYAAVAKAQKAKDFPCYDKQ